MHMPSMAYEKVLVKVAVKQADPHGLLRQTTRLPTNPSDFEACSATVVNFSPADAELI